VVVNITAKPVAVFPFSQINADLFAYAKAQSKSIDHDSVKIKQYGFFMHRII
jgi:hypothetical protein